MVVKVALDNEDYSILVRIAQALERIADQNERYEIHADTTAEVGADILEALARAADDAKTGPCT